MIVIALLVAAAAIAGALLWSMPRISSHAPGTLTNDATPMLRLRVHRPLGVRAERVDVRVDGERIDGDEVSVRDGGALVLVQAARLADGEHDVDAKITRVGVLQRTLHETWNVTVDTKAPSAKIVAPIADADGATAYADADTALVTKLPARVTVDAEPGSIAEVTSDAANAPTEHLDSDDAERRSVAISLPQGEQSLVVRVRDAAGNVTERTQAVLVDTTGPTLQVRAPRIVRDATLQIPVSSRDVHGVDVHVLLDGAQQEDTLVEQSTTPPPGAVDAAAATPIEDDAALDEEGEATAERADALPVAGTWKIALEDGAYEGRHALQVIATDSLGNETRTTRTIIVDSAESLNDATGLRTGARGKDVRELQAALVKAGVTTNAKLAAEARTSSYGATTRSAVQAYQSQHGMDADGVAGPDTVAGLTLKIVVDRARNTLTLYRLGSVVKSWGVATGSAEYPTPAGSYSIQSMQKDPTWTPPDSPWAKDAKPIGPGPDNPLGTRWMAINGTVGIHGTNNPSSIGYSVSHGCIRMRIPDVEALFDMVTVGTPVTVL